MTNSASSLEVINNCSQEYFANKVIEIFTQYISNKSNIIVPQHSPLRNFIYELAQNTPKIGNINDSSSILFNYISNSINNVNEIPNVCQNMSAYHIKYVNIFIYKYIELKYTTSIPNDMISTFKKLFPYIDDFKFINDNNFKFNWQFKAFNSKDCFNTMLQKALYKNCIHIPEGMDKDAYIEKLLKQGALMYDEYRVRVGYLKNLNSEESQEYFRNLIVKYKCKFIQTLENIPNPGINKSKIISMLHENNLLDFHGLKSYNWRDQTKTFIWSIQENTANLYWFKCKETDFSVVSKIFLDTKYQELTDFSNKPTDIVSNNRIGNNQHVLATPANWLIGILYDDTLNSTNIKYINSVSKIK